MNMTAKLEADTAFESVRAGVPQVLGGRIADAAAPDRQRAPWRSLQLRFLTITLSSVLIIIVAFFTYLEVSQYASARQQITEKLGRMLDSGSILLADATADRRDDEVRLLLALLLGDPDVASVTLDLANGNRLAAFGEDPKSVPEDMMLRRSIIHIAGEAPAVIGTIQVGTTYNRIDRELEERLRNHLILALLIVCAIGFGSYISLRLAVMQPLQRLLAAVEGWRGDNDPKMVDWRHNDEFGQLISSFNQMQFRQRFYQEELRLALNAAESADRTKTAFLAIIGHELRTPLNSVIGFCDLLKAKLSGKESAETDEYLDQIGASGTILLEMVNDILEITHAQAGTLALAKGHTALPGLVETVVVACRQRFPEDAAAIENAIPSTFPALEADPKRLARILTHLITNAQRFTPKDGAIRIGATSGTGGVEITITDTGCGIPADRLADLQEPFVQLSTDWQTHSAGAGLGLTYVKTIAECHGGAFRLESVAGEGTSAMLWLPAQAGAIG